MAEVSLRGVRKSYGDLEVIHGIDMEIKDGEFIVIVGPSGCGKSTLLRMIAGLEQITGGEVSIGDRLAAREAAANILAHLRGMRINSNNILESGSKLGLKPRSLSESEYGPAKSCSAIWESGRSDPPLTVNG